MNYNRTSRRNPLPGTRNHRRMMKDETGQHGGAPAPTPTPAPDNTGGNAGANSGESGSGDNTGQETDYSQFWAEPPVADSTSAGSTGSAGNGTPAGGSPEQPKTPANTLATDIQGLDFGSGVMTEAAIKGLGDGDATEFHKNINELGRNAVGQAVRLVIPIMAQLRDQLRSEMTNTVQSTNASRDDNAALLKAIPSAADPKVRPIVDSIFAQAKKVTKGDTAAAISMTKDMLRLQAQTLGTDIGLPPPSSGDSNGLTTSGNIDWLQELAGR